MFLVDYHLHTRLCGHAVGEVEDYLEEAARKGISEVGFCDHMPLSFLPLEKVIPGYAMEESELPKYVETIRSCAESSPVLVKLGIEADYVPGCEYKLSSILRSYPFDYVVGSVHFIDGWGFDNPDEIDKYSKKNIDQVYERYFVLVQQAALSGLFDVMAHPDLIKKFNYRPSLSLRPLYEDTAQAFKKAGVCVEVNTAGLRYPAGEIYPSPDLLEVFFKYGLPVTLGSDAHRPEQVGERLAEALKLIERAGYREIVLFNGRQRSFVKISSF